MASFDIVSKVDLQTLDNSINSSIREILNRWDFKDSKSSVELNKKDYTVNIVTENEMRLEAIEDIIRNRLIKQKIDPNCLDTEGSSNYASGNMLRKDVKIRQGIDKDNARKIMKIIKDSGSKVQVQQMDEQLRVSSKKLDELQETIALLRNANVEIPLQFINMKA